LLLSCFAQGPLENPISGPWDDIAAALSNNDTTKADHIFTKYYHGNAKVEAIPGITITRAALKNVVQARANGTTHVLTMIDIDALVGGQKRSGEIVIIWAQAEGDWVIEKCVPTIHVIATAWE
jgi:hypothetical protein